MVEQTISQAMFSIQLLVEHTQTTKQEMMVEQTIFQMVILSIRVLFPIQLLVEHTQTTMQ